MTPESCVYRELAAALRERLIAIADREHFKQDSIGHLERLKAVAAKIEALRSQLASGHEARLMHFLDRCSYDKALRFLEGEPD